MTLESVPQNDLPKTWAIFIFTTGYQVKPQMYYLALRSHKPFNLPKKKASKEKNKSTEDP